jgi:hypothetical protein
MQLVRVSILLVQIKWQKALTTSGLPLQLVKVSIFLVQIKWQKALTTSGLPWAFHLWYGYYEMVCYGIMFVLFLIVSGRI